MAVQFGVVTDTGTYGVITNLDITESAETATYADENGDVAGYNAYNESATISMTFTYDGTAAPSAGDVMTIDSVKYIIDEVKETEANDAFRTAEISGTRYITNTIPA